MLRIGIDLGGTKTEIRVLDDQGQTLLQQRAPTPAGRYQQTLDTICQLVTETEQQLGQQCSLGIGIPGAISPATGRVKNANSTCLIDQPLREDLQQRLQRPVRIANDADCFTLSEATDGAAAGADSVFGVIIGTGVGGGICIHGKILSGPNAICGEWGHNPLPWPSEADLPARDCYCGKQGCIETYLSGPGLCAQYQQLSGKVVDRGELIVKAAQQGQAEAVQVMDAYYDRLARSLAGVINILDPEVIVLGGGLSNIEALYSEIPQRWGEYVLSDRVDTQLRKAQYGDSSGARGAAWLWPL